MMRTAHLFAGAGGGIYADIILGNRPIFAVENDRFAADILRQRTEEGWFAGMQVFEQDIRLFDSSEFAGCVDSIHAGFPCTDISVAGNRAGIEGRESGLWSEVARIAGELRPRELFLENSPAIVSAGLDRVLFDLAELGFDAEWLTLSASAVGAPHKRDRWWCLARCADSDLSGQCADCGTVRQERRNDISGVCEALADSDIDRSQGKFERRSASPTIDRPSDGRDRSWWAVESDVGRVVNGLADRINRIKALGNGQVPIQAAVAYLLLDARYK